MKKWFLVIAVFVLAGHIMAQEDMRQKPGLQWSFNTSGPVYSSAVTDGNAVYAGSIDSFLYAVDLTTGKLLWKFKTGGDIRSTPVIHGNNILVVSGDGCLYAVNRNTHQLNWKFAGKGDRKYELYSFSDYYQSTPTITNDTLVFGAGNNIFCVNAATGQQVWEFNTGSVVHSSPYIYKGKVYIGSFDGFLYCLSVKDGSLVWKFKSVGHRFFPKGEMQGSPIVYDDMVFAGSRDYNFYSLDANKGTGLWNRKFDKGWAMGKPAVKDSMLYVGTSDDKVLMAFDPFNGRIKWQAEVKFNVFGSVSFSKELLYVGTLMGRVYAIESKTGKIVWQIDNERYNKNRYKYFKEDDSYRDDITTVIRSGNDFLAMYYDLGAVFSTPLLYKGYLIVTSTDGKIYAYKN